MGCQLINSECEFIDSFLKSSASCQFSVCIMAPSFAAHIGLEMNRRQHALCTPTAGVGI